MPVIALGHIELSGGGSHSFLADPSLTLVISNVAIRRVFVVVAVEYGVGCGARLRRKFGCKLGVVVTTRLLVVNLMCVHASPVGCHSHARFHSCSLQWLLHTPASHVSMEQKTYLEERDLMRKMGVVVWGWGVILCEGPGLGGELVAVVLLRNKRGLRL